MDYSKFFSYVALKLKTDENSIFKKADEKDIKYLKSSKYPDSVTRFYSHMEPQGCVEINGVRLESIYSLRTENEVGVPIYVIYDLGYRAIGATEYGDVFCLNVKQKTKDGQPSIYIASHDEIMDGEDYTNDEVMSKIKKVAGSFEEFLEKFVEEKLPNSFYDEKYTVEKSKNSVVTSDGFEYKKLKKYVRIIGYTGKTDMVIPEKIDNLPVKEMSEDFRLEGIGELGPLTSVIFPGSFTFIDSWFANNKITHVTIPNSITSIYSVAFVGNRLASVTIPDSVTYIGRNAFARNQLASVTIPNSVTKIGESAFEDNKLVNVVISNSVTSIEEAVFVKNQLTSVTIPDSVITIGKSAFAKNQLVSVVIPNSVTEIGEGAFYHNQLTSVTIPDSVTSIGRHAFLKNKLTSVVIPCSVKMVHEDAFDNDAEIIRYFDYSFFFSQLIKKLNINENEIYKKAAVKDIEYLKLNKYPDRVIQFYDYMKSRDCVEINGALLLSINLLQKKINARGSNRAIYDLGYRAIGATKNGDVFCINVNQKMINDQPCVYIASHDEILKVTDSFDVFLKKFVEGKLPGSFSDRKNDIESIEQNKKRHNESLKLSKIEKSSVRVTSEMEKDILEEYARKTGVPLKMITVLEQQILKEYLWGMSASLKEQNYFSEAWRYGLKITENFPSLFHFSTAINRGKDDYFHYKNGQIEEVIENITELITSINAHEKISVKKMKDINFENKIFEMFYMPAVRIIGKEFQLKDTESETYWERTEKMIWNKYCSYEKTLNKLPSLIPSAVVCWKARKDLDHDTYMPGVICPKETPVPEGLDYQDLPASYVAKGDHTHEQIAANGFCQCYGDLYWRAEIYALKDLNTDTSFFALDCQYLVPCAEIKKIKRASIRAKPKDSDIADTYFNRGVWHMNNRDFKNAITCFSEAIKTSPRSWTYKSATHISRGASYSNIDDDENEKKNTQKAIKDYIEAVRLDPDFDEKNTHIHYNLGIAYRKTGDYEKSIAEYTESIRLNPNVKTYNNRGSGYIDKGEFDKAIKDFDKAIKMDNYYLAYKNRGQVFWLKGELDKAIADFTEAIKLLPKKITFNAPLDVECWCYAQRGLAYFDKGNVKKAAVDKTKALQLMPDLPEKAIKEADNGCKKGGMYEVITDYSIAIWLNPNSAELHIKRGDVYTRAGDIAKAVKDLKTASRLEPDNAHVKQKLKAIQK